MDMPVRVLALLIALPLLMTNECELILEHTFADDDLTARLRIAPPPGKPRAYYFTPDDWDDLAGYVAAEANQAINKKLARELHDLHARIAEVRETLPEG